MDALAAIEAALPTCLSSAIDIRFEKLMMDRLGRGGFADVFRVFHAERDAILKQYRSTRDRYGGNERKMLEEARCMDVLRHPNICQLIGMCKTGTYRGLIIEYCGGSNLQDVLEKASDNGKHIDSLLVNRWCTIIADAMEFMARFYVHRDLKLENVLLKEKACICLCPKSRVIRFRRLDSTLSVCEMCNGIELENVTLKISDFGLACRVSDTPDERTGGTVQFMAPEVLGDRNFYTEKSDVYAFGIIMFTFMLGRPFGDSEDIDIVIKKLRSNVSLVVTDCTSVSITQLIRACTLASPDERPTFELLNRLLNERFDKYSKLKICKARDVVNREREAFIREYVHLIVRREINNTQKNPEKNGYDNPAYKGTNSESMSTRSQSRNSVFPTKSTSFENNPREKSDLIPKFQNVFRLGLKRLLKL